MTARKFNVESGARGAAIVAKARHNAMSSYEGVTALDTDALDALRNLIQAAIGSNLLGDDDYELLFCDADASEIALEAAELLARHQSTESLPVILQCFESLSEHEGKDLLADRGPEIIGYCGPESAIPLMEYVIGSDGSESTKSNIVDGIKILGDKQPAIRPALTPLIIEGLGNAKALHPFVNTQLR